MAAPLLVSVESIPVVVLIPDPLESGESVTKVVLNVVRVPTNPVVLVAEMVKSSLAVVSALLPVVTAGLIELAAGVGVSGHGKASSVPSELMMQNPSNMVVIPGSCQFEEEPLATVANSVSVSMPVRILLVIVAGNGIDVLRGPGILGVGAPGKGDKHVLSESSSQLLLSEVFAIAFVLDGKCGNPYQLMVKCDDISVDGRGEKPGGRLDVIDDENVGREKVEVGRDVISMDRDFGRFEVCVKRDVVVVVVSDDSLGVEKLEVSLEVKRNVEVGIELTTLQLTNVEAVSKPASVGMVTPSLDIVGEAGATIVYP